MPIQSSRRGLHRVLHWFFRQKYWLGIAAIALYAALIEPFWIEITQHVVGPAQKEQIRIAQISDLHLRSIGTRERAILDLLPALAPDVVVFSGDIVDRADSLALLDRFLSGITAPNKIAVLGNWEYWGKVDLAALRRTYERHGVKLLVNQIEQLTVRQRGVAFIGLDDATAGNARMPEFDQRQNSLLVQHSPGWAGKQIAEIRPTAFRLILSGHTHGGQIAIFGFPVWTPPGSGGYVHGFYNTVRGLLYVSRGLGTSGPPIRFGARPEIAIFTVSLPDR